MVGSWRAAVPGSGSPFSALIPQAGRLRTKDVLSVLIPQAGRLRTKEREPALRSPLQN